ncbi:DNA methylase [Altererythrobacter sp. B11]|uniref:anti-phage-associated DUF1156 domain-containing protein n=1 Tax=Altererythrobacter sp. B11 TaxID=2060312 RepID=UPI000DC6D4BB|nr:anti-phage-associated DUF1156 domain-containing protein [Altererythrobacter sp. B11]BBC70894.1 DNA methylase [Altererythrobacter sp. B11]
MTNATNVTPLSLKDAPSLIERLWPAQKISKESEAERKSVSSQTLTGLGSYWKGRKPLILNRACILGALLPATDDPETDLEIFEALMMIDDRGFVERHGEGARHYARLALAHGGLSQEETRRSFVVKDGREFTSLESLSEEALAEAGNRLRWSPQMLDSGRWRNMAEKILAKVPYNDKVDLSLRPEYLEEEPDARVRHYGHVWAKANAHLGTDAHSMPELVEQLGIMRFGHRPRVGDAFSGSGQIPFEALRTGCDTYASDPNPIAALLTWSSFELAGSSPEELERVMRELAAIERDVEDDMAPYETDSEGNRAKAYLYCLETTCPETGYSVPLVPSLVISPKTGTIGKLVPDHESKRIEIEIETGVGKRALAEAENGTVDGDYVTYEMEGETYRFSISSVRGDFRTGETRGNRLRQWSSDDIVPRDSDVFRERLYCIHWATAETLESGRQSTYFAGPTEADLDRDREVVDVVRKNLPDWREEGLVPDMPVEPGMKTDDPIRTRGWSNWLHLFHPRQILAMAQLHRRIRAHPDAAKMYFFMPRALDNNSRLNRWATGQGGGLGGPKGTFDNQALNTLINFCVRGAIGMRTLVGGPSRSWALDAPRRIDTLPGMQAAQERDIWITDPPYADAVVYHELTEFFISWLRKNPPAPFDGWTWDSRRPLAIQGEGEEFRRKMVATYANLAEKMPHNGMQVVMFTHQSGSVWADLAQIFWGAGLKVSAAWYIATETGSNAPGKKGAGLVQGTVILVLRKRLGDESGYEDEIAHEVRSEVARQIDTLVGLNQSLKGEGRMENLFEDADLQMAGYAAALRVLTGYTRIDGRDMTAEATRPRQRGEKGFVERIIDFAVQVANEHMVPDGLSPRLWQQLTGSERFYLKMLGLEAGGLKKLDNYQNFARAFRVPDYSALMADNRANSARLKRSDDLKHRTGFDIVDFGDGPIRAVLYGTYQLSKEEDADVILEQLRGMVENYYRRRDDLVEIAEYLALKRGRDDDREGRHAATLAQLIRNEKIA